MKVGIAKTNVQDFVFNRTVENILQTRVAGHVISECFKLKGVKRYSQDIQQAAYKQIDNMSERRRFTYTMTIRIKYMNSICCQKSVNDTVNRICVYM